MSLYNKNKREEKGQGLWDVNYTSSKISSIFLPRFQVAICRDVIRYENDTLARQPEPDPLLSDWIHQAAFQSNTIGLPRYCPSDGVGEITSSHVLSYLSQYYTPDRIVVTGINF